MKAMWLGAVLLGLLWIGSFIGGVFTPMAPVTGQETLDSLIVSSIISLPGVAIFLILLKKKKLSVEV